MNENELSVLLRCGLAPREIAYRIFKQISHVVPPDAPSLSDDEHAFLLKYSASLSYENLEVWLCLHPRSDNALISRLLLDRWQETREIPFGRLASPEGWRPEDLEELCDQLTAREPEGMWRRWLAELKGLAPLFHRLVELERSPEMEPFHRAAQLRKWQGDAPLAVRLWSWRRDDRALARELVALVQKNADAPAPLGAAGILYVLACVEKLGLLGGIDEPGSVLPRETVWQARLRPSQRRTKRPAAPASAGVRVVRFPQVDWPLSEEETQGEAFRALARRWPGDKRPQAEAWLLTEALRAARMGTPWNVVWALMPETEMRLALGLASLEMPRPALFAGWALVEQIRPGKEFPWEQAFRWFEAKPHGGVGHGEHLEEAVSFPDPFEEAETRDKVIRLEFCPYSCADRILLEAPFPQRPDPEFFRRFWDAAAAHVDDAALELGGRFWRAGLVARLLSLPLPRERARELLLGVLGWLREEDIPLLEPLVACGGTLSPEEFPPEKGFLLSRGKDGLALYRLVVGEGADGAIREWAREDLAASANRISFVGSGGFHLMAEHPDLLDEGLRQQMRALALTSYSFAREVGARAPWLLEGADMDSLAQQSARSDALWDLATYPASCLPILQGRFVESLRGWHDEQIETLEAWLTEHGQSEEDLIKLFLDQSPEAWREPGGIRWFAKKMSTRSAWDRRGRLVVRRSLDAGWPGLLSGVCWTLATTPTKGDAPHSMLPTAAIHEALARELISRIRAMVEEGRGEPAPLLRALFFLNPRSAVSGCFAPLLKISYPPGETLDLIRACGTHLRSSRGEDASVSDLWMAIQQLTPPPSAEEISSPLSA